MCVCVVCACACMYVCVFVCVCVHACVCTYIGGGGRHRAGVRACIFLVCTCMHIHMYSAVPSFPDFSVDSALCPCFPLTPALPPSPSTPLSPLFTTLLFFHVLAGSPVSRSTSCTASSLCRTPRSGPPRASLTQPGPATMTGSPSTCHRCLRSHRWVFCFHCVHAAATPRTKDLDPPEKLLNVFWDHVSRSRTRGQNS